MTATTGARSSPSKVFSAPPPLPNTKLGSNTVQSSALSITACLPVSFVRQYRVRGALRAVTRAGGVDRLELRVAAVQDGDQVDDRVHALDGGLQRRQIGDVAAHRRDP